MYKITLLFRSKKRNRYSIENMFDNIEPYLKKRFDVQNRYLPEERYLSLFKLIRNICYTLSIKSDIIHITGENYFCAAITPRKKTVLTILDYVAFNNFKGIAKFLDWFLMYYIPIKKSSFVTCISQATYNDTVSLFPWCKNKIKVVFVSISDIYQYKPLKFRCNKPTLLLIGSTPNKNITRVIKAVWGLKCSLDIVGKLSDEQIRLLEQFGIEYMQSCNISNEEVLAHYEQCDIVCFPSTYEGFGMPVVEGQAVGRPIVTSNIEPMVSVAGSGACLVDPFSVESIREGIKKVIEDDEYRKRIVDAGLENCKMYRNDKIAMEYVEIYKKILEK